MLGARALLGAYVHATARRVHPAPGRLSVGFASARMPSGSLVGRSGEGEKSTSGSTPKQVDRSAAASSSTAGAGSCYLSGLPESLFGGGATTSSNNLITARKRGSTQPRWTSSHTSFVRDAEPGGQPARRRVTVGRKGNGAIPLEARRSFQAGCIRPGLFFPWKLHL